MSDHKITIDDYMNASNQPAEKNVGIAVIIFDHIDGYLNFYQMTVSPSVSISEMLNDCRIQNPELLDRVEKTFDLRKKLENVIEYLFYQNIQIREGQVIKIQSGSRAFKVDRIDVEAFEISKKIILKYFVSAQP